MRIEKITVNWLKRQKWKVEGIYKPPMIEGVVLKELNPILDGRGEVTELWSSPWVEKEGLVVPKHCYQSATDMGVVKAWHLHRVHTDQLAVTRGKMQIVLVDVRKKSKTFGKVNVVFLGIQKPRLVLIPPGVMHGWKALSGPEVVVVNFQSEVYDAKDEFKFPWDCLLKEVWEPKNG